MKRAPKNGRNERQPNRTYKRYQFNLKRMRITVQMWIAIDVRQAQVIMLNPITIDK